MPRVRRRFDFRLPALFRFGRALGFGARERSERVTRRRQPPRQRSRRLVYSQAHVLLPFGSPCFRLCFSKSKPPLTERL